MSDSLLGVDLVGGVGGVDVVVGESEALLVGDDPEPVPHRVLLEEALGEVLDVSLAERPRRGDGKLAVTLLGHLDLVPEVASLAVHLDVLLHVCEGFQG